MRKIIDITYSDVDGSYILPVWCHNCGLKFAAKISKGYEWNNCHYCPRCGVSNSFTTGTVEEYESELTDDRQRTNLEERLNALTKRVAALEKQITREQITRKKAKQ